MANLHSDNLYASMAHTSSSICFPLHSLGNLIDLLLEILKGEEDEKELHTRLDLDRNCYLRNFGVTTYHSRRLLHEKEPALYLMIVNAGCDDGRIDYFVHAKKKMKQKRRY
jgi:hypothetical protein